MNKRTVFRLVSLLMLVIAVIFVLCAMAAPTLGSAIRIGPVTLGVEVWHSCYALYAAAMIGCFLNSFRYPKR